MIGVSLYSKIVYHKKCWNNFSIHTLSFYFIIWYCYHFLIWDIHFFKLCATTKELEGTINVKFSCLARRPLIPYFILSNYKIYFTMEPFDLLQGIIRQVHYPNHIEILQLKKINEDIIVKTKTLLRWKVIILYFRNSTNLTAAFSSIN